MIMTNIGPSLEDLLPKQKSADDGSVGSQLSNKIDEISIGEKEKETNSTWIKY